MFKLYNYSSKYFNNQDEIDAYIRSDGYGEDVCLSVVFTSTQSNYYSYQIGFNTSGPREQNQDDIPDTNEPLTIDYVKQDLDYAYSLWVTSGFT